MGRDCQAGSETKWGHAGEGCLKLVESMIYPKTRTFFGGKVIPYALVSLFSVESMIYFHDSCSLHSLFSDETVAQWWVHRMTSSLQCTKGIGTTCQRALQPNVRIQKKTKQHRGKCLLGTSDFQTWGIQREVSKMRLGNRNPLGIWISIAPYRSLLGAEE